MREQDTQCTNGEFSSTVNAALKKNFARVSSFTAQQFKSWKSLFLRSNYRLIILPTGHNLRGCTRHCPRVSSLWFQSVGREQSCAHCNTSSRNYHATIGVAELKERNQSSEP